MRAALGLVLMLAALMPAAAQEAGLRIRSGEHPDFSRLVIDPPVETGWRIARQGNRYLVAFRPALAGFDLSRIYQRIPRRRLKAVSTQETDAAEGEVLQLEVAPDHSLSVFRAESGSIVLDIVSGAPRRSDMPSELKAAAWQGGPAGGPDEPVSMAPSGKAGTGTAPPGAPPGATAGGGPQVQPFILQPPRQGTERLDISGLATALPPQPGGRLPVTLRLADARVLEAQQALVEQLGRAMTQGAVEPATAGQGTFPDSRPQETEGPTVIIDSGPNIEARTVFDRDAPKAAVAASGQGGVTCLPDSAVDLAAWAEEGADFTRLSELRRNLVGEFDRVDTQALRALAHSLLVDGFGTETRALLRAFPGALPEANLLTELAVLVEDGSAEASPLLAAQAGCGGAVALWAILARPRIPPGEVPDRTNLNRVFASYPADLRYRIGPPLASRLLAAGFNQAARDIAARMARAPGAGSAGFRLLELRFDLERGRLGAARARLSEMLRRGRPEVVEALTLLLAALRRTDQPVEAELLSDAAALAFQHRFSAAGAALRAEEILARARMQGPLDAFALLVHEAELQALPPPMVRNIADTVFRTPPPSGQGVGATVQAFFRYRDLLADSPDMDNARRHVATRLVEANLPAVALEVMQPGMGRLNDDDRVLLARIELLQGRPEAARRHLEGIPSEEADRLRREIGARTVSIRDVPAGSETAALSLPAALPVAGSAQPSLAAAGRMVAESRALRQEIEAQLRAIPPP